MILRSCNHLQHRVLSLHSMTDLNKPLPPAPRRASHDSERESIFDREAAGKTPEPPSPSLSIRRKTAPAPPITRRHSQLVPKSEQTHYDAGRLSPKVEEETNRPTKENRPRSDSVKAPPPPPFRRPTVRGSSHHGQLTSPSTVSLPAPPPSRGTSRAGRPPSVLSMDLSNGKRASMAPPPPPPRHGRRISIDAQSPGQSRRTSGEQPRRSIESARRGSASSSIREEESLGSNVARPDIMADLSALQQEIDALRVQSEKERVT